MPTRRQYAILAAVFALAISAMALAATLVRVLPVARAGGVPAWTHWWCSAATLHAGASGGARGGGLLAFAVGLLPHWPHLLALAAALATLCYLRRANARHHAEQSSERTGRASRTAAPPMPAPAR